MKRFKQTMSVIALSAVTLTAYNNCSSSGFSANTTSGGDTATSHSSTPNQVTGSENNIVAITMNCNYVNEPCVSVTLCSPSGANCQTIDNILLDTGSFGLRVFSSAMNSALASSLTPLSINGAPVGECVSYGDGSSDWGQVMMGNITLNQLSATNVPIQVINSTYGGSTVPSDCTDLDTSPSQAGFNGIIGVGLFASDCGDYCATTTGNGYYYSCPGGSCSSTGIAVPVAQQVTNPVALMPSGYNNGIVVQLPSVPQGGAVSLTGYMIMGIGGEADNTPASSVLMMPADGYANFQTAFNSASLSTAFIDSGSNGLYFPGTAAGIASCSNSDPNAPGFFCPSSEVSLTAVQAGSDGSNPQTVSFSIGDATLEMAPTNPNVVFSDLGANATGIFDWGLPFFLGRTIYVGFENQTSSLGTGPYWAY